MRKAKRFIIPLIHLLLTFFGLNEKETCFLRFLQQRDWFPVHGQMVLNSQEYSTGG